MNDRANLLISVATKTEPKRRTRLAALFHQTKHPDTDVPRSIEDYVQQTGVEWGRRWPGWTNYRRQTMPGLRCLCGLTVV